MPSASRRSLSASTRCWRRRSVRSLSCSIASRALRSASSYSRRFSPRCAWRSSTGRVAALLERLLHDLGLGQRRRADDLPGNRQRGRVVLDRELLGDLVLAAAGAVLQIEALAVGQHAVAHLEDLRVRLGALDRDREHVQRADRCRSRSAAAGTASAPRAAGCGRRPPARTPAPRRRRSSAARARARSGGSARTGS